MSLYSLMVGDDNEPLQGAYVRLYQKESKDGKSNRELPEEQRLPDPSGSRRAIVPRIVKNTRTSELGVFEFFAGPGDFYLIGRRGADRPQFTITDQGELEINLHAKRPVRGIAKGRVVLKSNPKQGVEEIQVFGYPEDTRDPHLRATTDSSGNFEARRLGSAQLVGAFSEDPEMGAIVRAEPGAQSIVLPLSPTAILRGTLVEEETGQPAANREIGGSIRLEYDNDTFGYVFRRSDKTDDAGRFEITGVVPGHLYRLNVVDDRDNDGQPRSWRDVGEVVPGQADTIELGELRVPRPYREPTVEDYIARAFKNGGDVSYQLNRKLADAELAYQQVLLVAADPKSEVTRQFFQPLLDYTESNEDLRRAVANYMILGVEPGQTEFLKDQGVVAPDQNGATFAILDPDGRLVVEADVDDLANDGKLDRQRLTEFLNTRRVPLPDAGKKLSSALATALREDKRVLVQVGGPGCAPCILLSRYLDGHNDLISKDYVYVKLDSRMPNADDVIGTLRKTSEGGIPWMVILSADGQALVTSDSDEGNVGYPSTETGKAHFEHMLRTTRQRLSDAEISSLLAGLEK